MTSVESITSKLGEVKLTSQKCIDLEEEYGAHKLVFLGPSSLISIILFPSYYTSSPLTTVKRENNIRVNSSSLMNSILYY